MARKDSEHFAAKHGPNANLDEKVRQALSPYADKGELPCAVAFKIATELGVPPDQVGRAADLMELRLVKCQLGLFGYQPKKSIVEPLSSVPPELEKAIRQGLQNGRLSCKAAWEISDDSGLHKMKVSGACNSLGIKIGPCQLGAF